MPIVTHGDQLKRRIFVFFILLFYWMTEAKAYKTPSTGFSHPLSVAAPHPATLKLLGEYGTTAVSQTLPKPSTTAKSPEQINSKADKRNMLLYSLLLPLVLVALLTFLLLRQRRTLQNTRCQLKRNEEELALVQKQLFKQEADTHLQHQALYEQRKELEEINKIKDKMFSIIAHDFRSPLNTVQGVLNLLHMDVLSPEELKAMLPHLTRKVDYSISLLDNLLNWARTQMNGIKMNTIAFTLDPEIEETIQVISMLARQKNIRVEKNIEEALTVLADPDMIQLVVRNLLSNAIKFTNPDGLIRISAEEKDNLAVISVSDTGVGMGESSLHKLFKQTGYSTQGTAQEKGTGLGLKLCSDFVSRNGGDIWVESKVNEGTTFYFSVPLAEVLEESACSRS